MFIELTKVSGEPVTINVLQIEAVEGTLEEIAITASYLNEPKSVLVKVNKAGYYVKESYYEITEKMKMAMQNLGLMPLMLVK